MRAAFLTLGSGALRVGLGVVPQLKNSVQVAFIDTCKDEAVTDALRNGWRVIEEEGVFQLGDRKVDVHIAGEGKGGGMNPKVGRQLLEKSFKGKESIIKKLLFLKECDICLLFGFAGNATGTNLAYVLSELMKEYPGVTFIPAIGIPLREQTTEIDTAVNITMKDLKKTWGKGKKKMKLPSPIVVDNAAFPTLEFDKMNKSLAEAFTFLLDVLENADFFRFDVGDIRRTLEGPSFALFGHGTVNGESDPARFLLDTLGSLVKIEQQWGQPSNTAGFGVVAVKTPSSDSYKRIARWASSKLSHCKVALLQDGSQRLTQVAAIVGGLPWTAIRPEIPGVK